MNRAATLLLPHRAEHVILRRLGIDDLADFQAYRHDPEVGRYQGWTPQPDADAQEFLAQMAQVALFPHAGWVQLGIVEGATGRLVGDIGISVAAGEECAEIGFSLAAHAQGRGLATDAVRETQRLLFGHTPVRRIVATTDARNLASIRLLERLCMQRIATEHTMFRNEACVEYTYAALRDAPR